MGPIHAVNAPGLVRAGSGSDGRFARHGENLQMTSNKMSNVISVVRKPKFKCIFFRLSIARFFLIISAFKSRCQRIKPPEIGSFWAHVLGDGIPKLWT